jgi:hypothetical protein
LKKDQSRGKMLSHYDSQVAKKFGVAKDYDYS